MQRVRTISILIAIIWTMAFGLNFVWEGLHTPLYGVFDSFGFGFVLSPAYVWTWITAALGDAFYILIIYVAIAIIKRDTIWVLNWDRRVTAHIIALGLIIAASIEIEALNAGSWVYTSYMPTIFGIGLTPLIQLSVTGLAVFYAACGLYIKNMPNADETDNEGENRNIKN